ncbi:ogr/Delta-like zinc finger family protein [Lelliottia nimipressuralis]
MALKCPFCSATSHCRTSQYEAPSVKRTYYQCRNIECSCTFTALESVETIIMKPVRNETVAEEPEEVARKEQILNRYGSASRLSSRQQIPV